MKFRWLALCVLELEGRSGPLGNFSPFLQVDAFGTYYEACKILIADVKCTMRTSFLQSFVSLGDQGDPTEHCVKIGDAAYSRASRPRSYILMGLGCAFTVYYWACKILIADVKSIMRTSFLQSFVSLGDQGDPTEPPYIFCRTSRRYCRFSRILVKINYLTL